MLKYIVKKAVSVLTVLFIVSFVTFFIIHLTPGDPARIMLGADAPQEAVEALREQMGLNRTLPVQYLEWLNDVLHGDLGTSIFMEGSMSYIIGLRMKPTIVLSRHHCDPHRNHGCQGQRQGGRSGNDDGFDDRCEYTGIPVRAAAGTSLCREAGITPGFRLQRTKGCRISDLCKVSDTAVHITGNDARCFIKQDDAVRGAGGIE